MFSTIDWPLVRELFRGRVQQTWLRCIWGFLVRARAEGHSRGRMRVIRKLAGVKSTIFTNKMLE